MITKVTHIVKKYTTISPLNPNCPQSSKVTWPHVPAGLTLKSNTWQCTVHPSAHTYMYRLSCTETHVCSITMDNKLTQATKIQQETRPAQVTTQAKPSNHNTNCCSSLSPSLSSRTKRFNYTNTKDRNITTPATINTWHARRLVLNEKRNTNSNRTH